MLLKSIPHSKMLPNTDGINHTNIYSRGSTELGRFLSHFQYHPVDTCHGTFNSLEGYWYWLMSGDDALRTLHGYEAKQQGRKSARREFDGMNFILDATIIKLDTMPTHLKEELVNSRLPLIHAYVHDGKYTFQTSMDNIIAVMNNWRLTQRSNL